jgi:hypothetical protein
MAIRARRAAAAALVAAAALALAAAPAAAQEPPDPGPNAAIPGSELITELLGWLKYGALASAVAGLLIGGIATGFGYSSSHYGSSAAGRNWLMGGLAAAVIAGLAHTVAIALYRAT